MIIVHIVEPFAAGIATYIKTLTEHLPDCTHIVVHGERNKITNAKQVKTIFPSGNVKFIRWKHAQREIRFQKDIKAFIELVSILRRFKHVNAVHLHSSKAGFLGRMACKILGITNVIYTPNGAPFLIENLSKFKATCYKRLEQVSNLFGGRVVCTSRSERRAYASIGVKAAYINNGTSMLKTDIVKSLSHPHRFRVVTAARIEDQKDPETFNEIAARFDDLKNFEFVWIGDGNKRHLLTSKNIRITGWLTQEQVHQEITNADIYLSTSKYEGLPFAVLEAMNLKKCLLLTDCVGNRDLVREGKNGELFTSIEDAEQKMLNFYAYRESIRTMGEYSYELCAKYFDAVKTAESYRYEYKKGLEKHTNPNKMKYIIAKKSWSYYPKTNP